MSPRHCGLFIITAEEQSQLSAPLKAINVNATTCGPIAHNLIKFQYKNANNAAIQSKFIFPVNSKSCIYHLSANVGGRKIVGKVKEKKAAQNEYNEAVAFGKSAVLAKESKEASDIIELELGAFGANEEADVTIKEVFEMKLMKSGTEFQYKFPTSLFVRYGETITASASQNAPTEYVLNFEVMSYAGVRKITPKPWLGNETTGQLFSFEGNRKVFEKDHDVVLDLTLTSDFKGIKIVENWQDTEIINPGDRKTDKKLMLSSILVHVPSTPISELPAKEYVFVVDCSGSMNGNRIEDARNTLQQLINSLPVGSYFNIVRFGSKYESLFRNPMEYNKKNKQLAIKLAGTMAADLGGTELHDCLKSVVECERQIVKYKRQVFVLTDGGIDKQDATLRLVKQHSAKNRFFSFGIGSGCSTALVNGLADVGMGSATFISDKGSFQWEKRENLSSICIKSLMASASQHISKIKITPDPRTPKEPVSMVVDSTCLNVFHEGSPKDVSLELTLANSQEENVVSKQDMTGIETINSPFEENVLHKLAAKNIISEMVTANLASLYGTGNKQDIIGLSISEQVLSPYTALVGVADKNTVVGVSQRVDVGFEVDYNCERFRCVTNSAYRSINTPRNEGYNAYMPTSIGCSVSPQGMAPGSMHRTVRYQKKKGCISSLRMVFKCCCCCCFSSSSPSSQRKALPMKMESHSSPPRMNKASDSESESKQVITYQSITNEQNPGGEWSDKLQSKHDDVVFKEIETTMDGKIVQFTVYAIFLLLVEFPDTFEEWKLTAIKGISFLKKSIQDLEDVMLKLLSLSRLEVDKDILSELLK